MDIQYKIFDVDENIDQLHEFLKVLKNAHNHSETKSVEWFKWKFYSSPYGVSRISYAFNGAVVVGSNAYGQYKLMKDGVAMRTVMPYETFVNPAYQGKGVFKKLLEHAEEKARADSVKLMIAFPNQSSIKGFLNKGWTKIDSPIHYWVKPILSVTTIKNITHLKKAFVELKAKGPNNFIFNNLSNSIYYNNQYHGVWSKEFLDWRFNQVPQAEYNFIHLNGISCLARIGFRGKLKEAQILFIDYKIEENLEANLKGALKELQREVSVNIISFAVSLYHPIFNKMNKIGFFRLPSSSNFVYKFLDKTLEVRNPKFSLCGLDFHTY